MANNGLTLTSNSRVTLGLLVAIAALAAAAASGWVNVWAQANQALSRTEAYQTFVAKIDYTREQDELCARLGRIEDKIDRLAEKQRAGP